MDEISLKQYIKVIRERSYLIIFFLSFLLVIFVAFYFLFSTTDSIRSKGEISSEAVSTKIPANLASNSRKEVLTYFVKKGDSSWSIATQFLGNGQRYLEIEKLNDLKHNQLLEIGQIIFIKLDSSKFNDANTNLVSDEMEVKERTKFVVYTVETGDSLWTIAKKNYSNPFLWIKIYQFNREVIGSDPDLITPLMEIKLPDL